MQRLDPTSSAYPPAAQAAQVFPWLAPLNLPTAHAVQLPARVPLNVPAGQSLHAVAFDRPLVLRPASQFWHAADFSDAANVPASHAVHPLSRLLDLKPAGQTPHHMDRPSEYSPGPHGSHVVAPSALPV